MTWTLWYADGSAFTSEDGEAWQSPPLGVVCVTQDVPFQGVVSLGEDFFVHRTDLDAWIECSDTGLALQVTQHAHHIDCVRPGEWMLSTDWKALMRRVREG